MFDELFVTIKILIVAKNSQLCSSPNWLKQIKGQFTRIICYRRGGGVVQGGDSFGIVYVAFYF